MLNIDVPYKQLSKIEGLECFSKYYVDTNGNVYSVQNPKKIKKLTPCWSRSHQKPYQVVILHGDNKEKKNVYIHHLVAKAFIPSGFRGKYISHKDEDTSNNCLSNIYYTDIVYKRGKRGKGKKRKSPQKVFTFSEEILKEIELLHQATIIKGIHQSDKYEFLDSLVSEMIEEYCNRKGLKKIVYQLREKLD